MYSSDNTLPPLEDYSMRGRTYRYLKETPLYRFGYGLSYTRFEYSDLRAETKNGRITGSVKVRNAGKIDGEEVAQAYLRYEDEAYEKPNCSLVLFSRIKIKAGEEKEVVFTINEKQTESVTKTGQRVVYPGRYVLYVGGRSPLFPELRGSYKAGVSKYIKL